MKFLVWVEGKNGKANSGSLGALSETRKIAGDGVVTALVFDAALAGDCAKFGADAVVVGKSDGLSTYSTEGFSAAVQQVLQHCGCDTVIMAATAAGRDVAPRVAMALNAAFIADVTGMSADGDKFTCVHPVFAGKAIQTLSTTAAVKVISTRTKAFLPAANPKAGAVSEFAVTMPTIRAKVVETKVASSARPLLTEADAIVAGGRGLKSPEAFKMIEDLADVLGAAVGASRAVVDSGWRPHEEQVGQTGKTVSPSLYIAVGISGAVQHLAGMNSSKTIVAINPDAQAPIFKVADYSIACDAAEVVPQLISALKAR